jgi:hypothetical protein
VRALPSIQKMWEKHQGKGLRIFLVASQGETLEQMQKYARERGLTFPIPLRDGSDFSRYPGDGGLPFSYVIGPDGKVVYEGRAGSYEAEIEKQIARIKYPGLGKLEVARGLERAALAYSSGEFERAREESAQLKERQPDNAELQADADFIIQRVEQKARELRTKIEDAKEAKRYHEALEMLEVLEKGFRGSEIGDKARDERRELNNDREVRKEVAAWNNLQRVIQANERARDDGVRKRNLAQFYERNKGTAAAEEARRLAEAMN